MSAAGPGPCQCTHWHSGCTATASGSGNFGKCHAGASATGSASGSLQPEWQAGTAAAVGLVSLPVRLPLYVVLPAVRLGGAALAAACNSLRQFRVRTVLAT